MTSYNRAAASWYDAMARDCADVDEDDERCDHGIPSGRSVEERMNLKNEAAWQKCVEVNDDPYSKACVDYAERWANLMEERMAGDRAMLASVAKQASHDANTGGITGYMYGAAVSMLLKCWEHGEALRRWHNKDTQIGDEGDRANESGGVLNPALLNIRTS